MIWDPLNYQCSDQTSLSRSRTNVCPPVGRARMPVTGLEIRGEEYGEEIALHRCIPHALPVAARLGFRPC